MMPDSSLAPITGYPSANIHDQSHQLKMGGGDEPPAPSQSTLEGVGSSAASNSRKSRSDRSSKKSVNGAKRQPSALSAPTPVTFLWPLLAPMHKDGSSGASAPHRKRRRRPSPSPSRRAAVVDDGDDRIEDGSFRLIRQRTNNDSSPPRFRFHANDGLSGGHTGALRFDDLFHEIYQDVDEPITPLDWPAAKCACLSLGRNIVRHSEGYKSLPHSCTANEVSHARKLSLASSSFPSRPRANSIKRSNEEANFEAARLKKQKLSHRIRSFLLLRPPGLPIPGTDGAADIEHIAKAPLWLKNATSELSRESKMMPHEWRWSRDEADFDKWLKSQCESDFKEQCKLNALPGRDTQTAPIAKGKDGFHLPVQVSVSSASPEESSEKDNAALGSPPQANMEDQKARPISAPPALATAPAPAVKHDAGPAKPVTTAATAPTGPAGLLAKQTSPPHTAASLSQATASNSANIHSLPQQVLKKQLLAVLRSRTGDAGKGDAPLRMKKFVVWNAWMRRRNSITREENNTSAEPSREKRGKEAAQRRKEADDEVIRALSTLHDDSDSDGEFEGDDTEHHPDPRGKLIDDDDDALAHTDVMPDLSGLEEDDITPLDLDDAVDEDVPAHSADHAAHLSDEQDSGGESEQEKLIRETIAKTSIALGSSSILLGIERPRARRRTSYSPSTPEGLVERPRSPNLARMTGSQSSPHPASSSPLPWPSPTSSSEREGSVSAPGTPDLNGSAPSSPNSAQAGQAVPPIRPQLRRVVSQTDTDAEWEMHNARRLEKDRNYPHRPMLRRSSLSIS